MLRKYQFTDIDFLDRYSRIYRKIGASMDYCKSCELSMSFSPFTITRLGRACNKNFSRPGSMTHVPIMCGHRR